MNNPQSNKLISDNMACRDDCIPIVFGLLGFLNFEENENLKPLKTFKFWSFKCI